jgi:uncharacterized protein with HEPN domain
MPSNNRDTASIWDMVQAGRYIQLFTGNVSFEEYLSDIRTMSAVERQFEILGEAARRVSDEFRQAHPDIDWQRVVGLRNVVIHRYDEINQEVLWSIVQAELPFLLTQLEPLITPSPPEDGESTQGDDA